MATMFRELFLSAVRTAWTVLGDFTPRQTIDELARLADEVRSRTFDAPNQEMLARLEAQSVAKQRAASVMAQSGASPEALAVIQEEGSLLERLLSPLPFERDVLAGTLSPAVGAPGWVWQRTQDQTGTATFITRLGRDAVAPLFEDRSLRNEAVRLQAMVSARQEALNEVRPLLAPENRKLVDAKLQALARVTLAIATAQSEAGRSSGGRRP